MPVPTAISSLSQTAASNSPPGTESPTSADDYLRQYSAFIAMLRDGIGFTDPVQLASAATTSIGAQNSLFVEITGTTTITSFGTTYEGPRFLRFTAALTLTHNATTLNLPGAANITTAAGDACLAVPNQALNGWNVVQFNSAANSGLLASSAEVQAGTNTTKAVTPASLRGGALVSGTAVATTSNTSHEFSGIPSWVKRITVMFDGVSTNGTDNWLIQLGDSGGVEVTGYAGTTANIANGVSPVTAQYAGAGFVIPSGGAANVISGSIVLTLLTGTTWVATGALPLTSSSNFFLTGGTKALSATLDRVRLTTTGGVNTFDAGSMNIVYE